MELAEQWANWFIAYTKWRFVDLEQGEPPRPPKEPKMILDTNDGQIIGMQDGSVIRFTYPE